MKIRQIPGEQNDGERFSGARDAAEPAAAEPAADMRGGEADAVEPAADMRGGEARGGRGDRPGFFRRHAGAFIRISIGFALVGLCALLIAWARNNPDGVEHIYRPFSMFVSGVLGRINSVVPYAAVGELVIYSLGIAAVVLLVISIAKKWFWEYIGSLVLFAGAAALFFTLSWGLNYYAPPLSDTLGMTVRQYSKDELYDACRYYLTRANEYAVQVERNEDGVFDAGGYYEICDGATECYEALSEDMPRFEGIYSRPKAVTMSRMLSWCGIGGIYNPFFGECCINIDTPDAGLGFTLCHEMAHRLGVAPENEANFAAFLACAASDDPNYLYSGYYQAFVYCLNKLDADMRDPLYAIISREVYADMAAVSAYYKSYEGPVQEASDKINDNYLKTFDQDDGVRSYGMVVDLLIAYRMELD